MTREDEIKKIALCYAHDELKDSQSPIEDVVAAAFIDGAHYADAHPHWISVEDELPPRFWLDQNQSDLVITYGLHTMLNYYNYERGEWARDSEITHWMHLSPPPVLSNSENTGKNLKGGEE